jgi:hypothetical protein
MNERIKELAVQAGAVNVWEWASDDVLDTKNMDAAKFAELIVRECISKLDDIGVIDRDSRTIAMKVISEHFGVEE